MARDEKVLVYEHQAENSVLGKSAMAAISKTELNHILEENPKLQKTSKPLKRTDRSVEVRQHDLYTQAQKNGGMPNYNTNTNIASVTIHLADYLHKIVNGDYSELVILSRKRGND